MFALVGGKACEGFFDGGGDALAGLAVGAVVAVALGDEDGAEDGVGALNGLLVGEALPGGGADPAYRGVGVVGVGDDAGDGEVEASYGEGVSEADAGFLG